MRKMEEYKQEGMETGELRNTGSGVFNKEKRKGFISTFDLIAIAILGVTGGAISGLIPFSLLIKTWYPFIGGTQLISGHHVLWMVIAYGITRKKVSIFLTAIIKALVMFLVGGQWGLFELFISTYEAFFIFLGFLIIELLSFKGINERETFLGWGIAAGIGNLSQVPFFWIITGKIYILHYSLFIMAMMFGFVSGVFIAGMLGKLIVDRLRVAGIK
jgi:hypothetical protein